MKTKTLLIGCMAALCMSACTSNDNRRVIDVVQEPEIEEPIDNFRHEAQPIALTRSQEDINTRLQDFSLQVFKQMYADKQAGDNVLFSPFSLNVALGMFANAMEGNTLAELLKTMNLEGFTVGDLNDYYQTMLKGIKEADDQVAFSSANSFWYHQWFSPTESYAEKLKNYDAEAYVINPASAAEAAKDINNWVSDKTNGKITSIIEEKQIDELIWALINAIYYKGGWKHEFAEGMTINQQFTTESGEAKQMDTMRTTSKFLYQGYDGYGVAHLPYNDGAFDFFVVLPDNGTDITSMIEKLSYKDLLVSDYYTVNIEMPKFEVEYKDEQLLYYLSQLNPNITFNGDEIHMLNFDLTGHEFEANLALEIIQKTYMKVDEKGTEAAAVTAILAHGAPGIDTQTIIDFHMDHPFLYGIIENSTNTPLFIGYYGN